MQVWCRRLAESVRFQAAVTAVIVVTAVLMGVETSAAAMARYGAAFHAANVAIQSVFVAEIAVRIGAHGRRPLRFFRDGWNLFDFLVVALSLLPAAGPAATVARLARLLRVTRLVSVSAELRLIVATMLRSIPSLGHVTLLLGLLLYVYAVVGFHAFHAADPERWGTLGRALLTLFQILTLEGWVEVQGALIGRLPWVWVYFASFVVVAVFVVINLFIAVVLNNLELAKTEERRAAAPPGAAGALERIAALRAELDALERELVAPARRAGGGA